MKYSDLQAKSTEDLAKLLNDKRSDLAEARRSNAAGELSNTRRIRELRKEIAQLLTAHNEPKPEVKEQKS